MIQAGGLPLLVPEWDVPAGVHAVVTTRAGGVSGAPWDSLNLGMHVGDDPGSVRENRARLVAALRGIAPCSAPQWLNQVHGVAVAEAEPDAEKRLHHVPDADAVTTAATGIPCVVMTADCLPVFFCDADGTRVAVAHAGWRGLCDGVLEAVVARFPVPERVLVWLGPAIGPERFEVGAEVRAAFMAKDAGAAAAFRPGPNVGRWLADIYALARLRLERVGVHGVSGGGFCTVTEGERFFSYRRDGHTGRMASVIWLHR